MTSWTAKSRLAHAIRRGENPEVVAELRTVYYCEKTRERLTKLITERLLTPDQCRDLADMLARNGGGAGGK